MEGDEGGKEHEHEKLPPGFRFHPTDEELITYYLINKITDSNFTERAVADVDLNKCEPWDLPGKAKMGEKEWYFFSLRDRKYPTGVRTNRATNSGYWKTTGKDREIYSNSEEELVGMKKTLVFYRGRAPRGEKTNWVMHEYRIHAKSSYRTSTAAKDEWVVCRVIQKSGGVKKYSSGHGHSRAVNPYNLEIGPSGSSIMTNSQMMMIQQQQQQQQPDAYHQFPVGRNYISQAELEQLSRINYRAVSTNALNFPPQSQFNYAHVSGGSAASSAAAVFTMSGLNLNLGGATLTQPHIPPSAAGINQHDHVTSSSMLPNGYASTTTDHINNNANAMGAGRYVLGMDHYADSDTYWPTY